MAANMEEDEEPESVPLLDLAARQESSSSRDSMNSAGRTHHFVEEVYVLYDVVLLP